MSDDLVDSHVDPESASLKQPVAESLPGSENMTTGYSIWSRIYNHNPFYVISTMCLLYGILSIYRHIPIGEINLWGVMGLLCGYTVLYACISVAVIRFGKVWEDARSILLLILILFLAISVCMDDLMIAIEDLQGRFWLSTAGFIFAIVVTEMVLKLGGFRLRLAYLIPFYFFIALFFYAPFWFATRRDYIEPVAIQWGLLYFPTIAAGIVLTLLPAVWLGEGYIKKNGTPWSWPMYPWSVFFMLIVAVIMRTFALAMTFGPGQLWNIGMSGKLEISFSTICGVWFYIPLFASVALLLIEGGFVTRNSRLRMQTLLCTLLLIPLSLMIPQSEESQIFLQELITTCGSPLWVTLWILVLIYTWSLIRGEELGGQLLMVILWGFCYVGPETVNDRTLADFQSWPLVLNGMGLLGYGLWQRMAWLQYLGTCICGVSAGWLVQDVELRLYYREYIFGVLWISSLVIGFANKDVSAYFIRGWGAVMCLFLGFYVIDGNLPYLITWQKSFTLFMMSMGMYAIFLTTQSMMYKLNSLAVLTMCVYLSVSHYYMELSQLVGRQTMAAFCISLGTLLIGVMISAHKGKWFNSIGNKS